MIKGFGGFLFCRNFRCPDHQNSPLGPFLNLHIPEFFPSLQIGTAFRHPECGALLDSHQPEKAPVRYPHIAPAVRIHRHVARGVPACGLIN